MARKKCRECGYRDVYEFDFNSVDGEGRCYECSGQYSADSSGD